MKVCAMDVRHWIVSLSLVAAGLATSSAIAQVTGASSSAAPGLVASLVPEFVTMDQKLAASDQVFVGVGRRIYLLDRSGREIALDAAGREASAGDGRQAILEVAVEQELNAPNSQRASGVAKFLLEAPAGIGAKPVTYDELAARHIGKKGIYFARRQLPPASESGGAGGARAALPMLLSLVNTPARRGPVDNPLPISELQTVMNAMLINGHSTEDPNCF
jgi:hypothetical protein